MKPLFLLFLALALPLAAQVKVTPSKSSIAVDIDGKPFTTFFIGTETPKPYLHPLRTASGKIVTRMYPVENIPGESKDHPHHRGLWYTHGDVNGFDFWSNEPGQKGKKGKVVLSKVVETKSGKTGVIKAVFDWIDGDGKKLLVETRTMTFYRDPALRVIDFDIQLKGIAAAKFGDTKEGFFAIRLATQLEEAKHTGKMTDSEGRVGEKNVWGKRAAWVDYAGELDGEKVGIAIFDHPKNPRYPTYWHARGYGLFAANIFGVHDFERDKTKDGSMTLEPGQTWHFIYRVVIHPGDTASANIGALYQKFAK